MSLVGIIKVSVRGDKWDKGYTYIFICVYGYGWLYGLVRLWHILYVFFANKHTQTHTYSSTSFLA